LATQGVPSASLLASRWQFTANAIDTWGKFTAGVIDTCGHTSPEIYAYSGDTFEKFATTIINDNRVVICHRWQR
jgi:hypothetical protein